jgi:CTP synthase
MVKRSKSLRKYVFVTGGVMSSVGKGVSTASLALLIKKRGYKVTAVKYEGYLNVDAGTINPIQHGDAFLCEDGTEADMDLGTYERFLDQDMQAHNFYTFGKVLKTVLDKERSMFYDGEDVEPIPHVRDELIEEIIMAGEKDNADIVFTELGGTVGEPTNSMNAIYYEAIREMKRRYPEDVIHIHVGFVLYPEHLGEPKTKPTQISIRLLVSYGIPADFLIVRGEQPLDERRKELLAMFSDLDTAHTINAHDVANVYQLPVLFAEQKFDQTVLQDLQLPLRKLDIELLRTDTQKLIYTSSAEALNITIAGKYFQTGDHRLADSYYALIEAIKHASWANSHKVKINYVNTEDIEAQGTNLLEGSDGIIVPIGWGSRGVEGKIAAVQYARTNKVPYLGLCYGMQLAAVEYARNVAGLANANSEEVDPQTKYPVVHSIPFNEKYQVIKGDGVSMRLGAFDCIVKPNTLAHRIYEKYPTHIKEVLTDGSLVVSERHRHRYEFNNDYLKKLSDAGLVFSGMSPDNFFVEMIELSQQDHPFFFATQAHPEYKSRPWFAHPVFIEFIKHCE